MIITRKIITAAQLGRDQFVIKAGTPYFKAIWTGLTGTMNPNEFSNVMKCLDSSTCDQTLRDWYCDVVDVYECIATPVAYVKLPTPVPSVGHKIVAFIVYYRAVVLA